MHKEDLIRKLNSVGKAAFVEHFSLFQSCAAAEITRQECIDTLVASGLSNSAGAAIRTGQASLIFRFHREYEALALVTSADVPPATIKAAHDLIAKRK